MCRSGSILCSEKRGAGVDAALGAGIQARACGLMSALALKVIALREHNIAGLGRPSRSSTSALFSDPSPLSWANRAIASVSLRPAHRSRRSKGCLSEGIKISLSGIFAALVLPVQPQNRFSPSPN